VYSSPTIPIPLRVPLRVNVLSVAPTTSLPITLSPEAKGSAQITSLPSHVNTLPVVEGAESNE